MLSIAPKCQEIYREVIMQRVKTRALDDNNESTNQNKNNSNEIIAKNSVLMIYSGPACYSLRRSGEYKYLIQDRTGQAWTIFGTARAGYWT